MNPIKILQATNKFLSFIAFSIAIYLIVLPITPEIAFAIQNSRDSKIDIHGELKQDKNRIIIPKIFVDSEILEGENESVLNKGIWRRPKTSTPDKVGNTVLVAHRFLYTYGDKTFFHLDKINVGDEFALIWNKQKYLYKVSEIKIVDPEEIEVEQNTDESIVTLYTCTPLWTADKRLVIVGKLEL